MNSRLFTLIMHKTIIQALKIMRKVTTIWICLSILNRSRVLHPRRSGLVGRIVHLRPIHLRSKSRRVVNTWGPCSFIYFFNKLSLDAWHNTCRVITSRKRERERMREKGRGSSPTFFKLLYGNGPILCWIWAANGRAPHGMPHGIDKIQHSNRNLPSHWATKSTLRRPVRRHLGNWLPNQSIKKYNLL